MNMMNTKKTDPAEQPVAEFRGIVKRFGEKVAVDHIDLDLKRGEVLAELPLRIADPGRRRNYH